MDAVEFRTAIRAMQREIGERCRIWASINERSDEMALGGSIYTNWPNGDVVLRVNADDWGALLDKLRTGWAAHQVEYRRKTIRNMALEIIRITADQGACTDAALRGFHFTAAQVAELGAEACADADAMASNGPFAITHVPQANAA